MDPRFFSGRRLLVREITSPFIVAAIVEGDFVNDPQIISVVPKTGERSLEFLWAVLNSKFGRFFHFNASPKATKGLFPKILVGDINKFPLPADFDQSAAKAIEELVLKAHDCADNVEARLKTEAQIDSAVMSIFGLSKAEVAIIDATLKRPEVDPQDTSDYDSDEASLN